MLSARDSAAGRGTASTLKRVALAPSHCALAFSNVITPSIRRSRKARGLRLALALVVDEHRQRRGVDRGEDRALGVVVVIGRGVAREAPHRVGAVPAERERAAGVPRHRHDRQRAAQRFFLPATASSRNCTRRGCARGPSSRRALRRANAVGHARRRSCRSRPQIISIAPPGKASRATVGIDPAAPLPRLDRGLAPAVEHRRVGNRAAPARSAQFVERQVGHAVAVAPSARGRPVSRAPCALRRRSWRSARSRRAARLLPGPSSSA